MLYTRRRGSLVRHKNQNCMSKNIVKSGAKSTPEVRHERDGLFVFIETKNVLIPYAAILYVEAQGSYCRIHLRDKKVVKVTKRMSLVEECLPPSHFVRVHYSFIVSLFDITEVAGSTLYLGEKYLPIGRVYRERLIDNLNIL